MTSADAQELTVVAADGTQLGGSLWLPATAPPSAVVLMWPGSGPSDRHNDVFFPPIRSRLLEDGIGVASFDKRGVGASGGHWSLADIADQAADAISILAELRTRVRAPLGLYGHSQGGWVVLEAAARDPAVSFVITSSGPGVSPFAQERHAGALSADAAGLSPAATDALLADFDRVCDLVRSGMTHGDYEARLAADPDLRRLADTVAEYAFVPDAERWVLTQRMLDHDPGPALARIGAPILALFGADDRVVPVQDSIGVYRAKAHAPTIEVFPGADHRLQLGSPERLADGYLDVLAAWIHRAVS